MHRGLKRFGFNGIINDDADFPRMREEFESIIIDEMREAGYVPVLDLGPFFSTQLRDDQKYDFVISLYGLFVGKRKSWDYVGVDAHGKLYQTNTQKVK